MTKFVVCEKTKQKIKAKKNDYIYWRADEIQSKIF